MHKDRSKVRSSIAKYELKDEVKLLLAVYNGSPSPSPPLLSFSFFLPFSSSPFSIGCPSSAGRADQQLAQRAQPLHCQGKGRQVTSPQAIVVSLPGPPTIQFWLLAKPWGIEAVAGTHWLELPASWLLNYPPPLIILLPSDTQLFPHLLPSATTSLHIFYLRRPALSTSLTFRRPALSILLHQLSPFSYTSSLHFLTPAFSTSLTVILLAAQASDCILFT